MGEFFEKSKRGRGKAKHAILDQYLKAFFAILCQCRTWNTPVLYIDGFAGAGTYKTEDSNEEIGSPVVAYQAATEHSLIENFKKNENTIMLIFVEKNEEQYLKLKKCLKEIKRQKTDLVRSIVKFRVVKDDFASYLERFLQDVEEFQHSPMFVFADPFGYSGNLIPMKLFKQLLERQANEWLPTEIFITVMDSFARRFISDSRKSSAINALMGAENWHHLTEQSHLSPEQRRNDFIELYISNLKKDIPEAITLKFGMKDQRNRHIYHLIFLTSHIKGIEAMKKAMWKKTQTSTEMVFSEWVENRNNDGANLVDKDKKQVAQCLYELITNEFRGSLVDGKRLELYIWLETPYISNVKVELKKLLRSYAKNDERAFENIRYKFPLVK